MRHKSAFNSLSQSFLLICDAFSRCFLRILVKLGSKARAKDQFRKTSFFYRAAAAVAAAAADAVALSQPLSQPTSGLTKAVSFSLAGLGGAAPAPLPSPQSITHLTIVSARRKRSRAHPSRGRHTKAIRSSTAVRAATRCEEETEEERKKKKGERMFQFRREKTHLRPNRGTGEPF